MICKDLIDTPYKDIRLAIQNYNSPEARVVERAKFLFVIQGVGESDDHLLVRLREERYCDLKNLKTASNVKRSW